MNSLDNIYVTVGSMDYQIPVNTTFYDTTSSGQAGKGSPVCVIQIQDIGSTVNYFIAGDVFFKLYYGAFNTEQNSMGLSVNMYASGGAITATKFGSKNVGLIVGITCGVLVLILAIGAGVYWYKKKAHANEKTSVIQYTRHGESVNGEATAKLMV